jgi:D-alanine-D-alanine ligase
MSAQGVIEAIDPQKYDIVPIGITKEGLWLASGDPMGALITGAETASQPAALLARSGPLAQQCALTVLRPEEQGNGLSAVRLGQLDVVFPILHGPYGEDGTIQGLLELAGIPYVGAGVTASSVGMDKALFKDIMRAHGLPVVPYRVVKRKEWRQNPDRVIARIESEIGYACFVKPANLGSSVGISKAHDRRELRDALDEASLHDRKMLVEVAVDAREIEVSVLGNDEPLASVPGEIVPCREFYDYAAKYLDGKSELRIPAPIPDETAKLVRQMAVQTYLAMDCAGMARADFLLDRKTGAVAINEVNTIPGFTPISMYPKLWEASGISYGELIDRLIQLALERHAEKRLGLPSRRGESEAADSANHPS